MESLQSGVFEQVVALVALQSVSRKHSLSLLSNSMNMKKLQLESGRAHCSWQTDSFSNPDMAAKMLEMSSEQRSPLWKRSHWADSSPDKQLLNKRKKRLLANIFLAAGRAGNLYLLQLKTGD